MQVFVEALVDVNLLWQRRIVCKLSQVFHGVRDRQATEVLVGCKSKENISVRDNPFHQCSAIVWAVQIRTYLPNPQVYESHGKSHSLAVRFFGAYERGMAERIELDTVHFNTIYHVHK